MKIYHVETQEDYDALMVELKEKGYDVSYVKSPKFFKMGKNCIFVFYNMPIQVASLEFAKNEFPEIAIEKYKSSQNVSCKERINKELNESVRALGKALKDSKKQNDVVNSPSHYKQGERETIENIRDTISSEGYQGYCVGNVVKYLARYKFKNGLEDVRKAKKYIEFLGEELIKQEG